MRILGEKLGSRGVKCNFIELGGIWGKCQDFGFTQRILVKGEDNKRILGKDSEICGKTIEIRERSKEIWEARWEC